MLWWTTLRGLEIIGSIRRLGSRMVLEWVAGLGVDARYQRTL